MSRVFRVAAAQMGPNHKTASRESILARMCALLNSAADEGATLVVFPELALTNFFPRWMHDEASLQSFFEPTMPNPQVQPLFDLARERGVGFLLCYAELAEDGKRYNTSITVGTTGELLGKYRKVHLPGSYEPREGDKVNQLEKRYFTPGNLGFPAFRGDPAWHDALMGMLICNDRRWPEGWRSYALQGVELMLIGYNSAAYDPNGGDAEDEELRTFHSMLVTQANAYMNSVWAVSTAKAGPEDGFGLIGGTCIVDPNGIVVAISNTLDDEIVVADIDLDACKQGREKMFNFAAHRRPEHYRRLIDQVGVEISL